MISFSLSSPLGIISTVLWGTRSLAGDRIEPRMVLCMWLQVRLFKARAPAVLVPGHLSLISQRRPTAHTLLPLLFPWLLIWLWWAPLNFLVFTASTQRIFFTLSRAKFKYKEGWQACRAFHIMWTACVWWNGVVWKFIFLCEISVS